MRVSGIGGVQLSELCGLTWVVGLPLTVRGQGDSNWVRDCPPSFAKERGAAIELCYELALFRWQFPHC